MSSTFWDAFWGVTKDNTNSFVTWNFSAAFVIISFSYAPAVCMPSIKPEILSLVSFSFKALQILTPLSYTISMSRLTALNKNPAIISPISLWSVSISILYCLPVFPDSCLRFRLRAAKLFDKLSHCFRNCLLKSLCSLYKCLLFYFLYSVTHINPTSIVSHISSGSIWQTTIPIQTRGLDIGIIMMPKASLALMQTPDMRGVES